MQSILIAEDDPIQRRTMRRFLEDSIGLKLEEAADGAQALLRLKQADEHDIALLLIDLRMPVVDGMALLRQVRKEWPHIPCLILTGSTDMAEAVEAMQLGAVDFISKPVERERLLASVRNALALRELRGEVERLRNPQGELTFDTLARLSPGLAEAITLGKKAAQSDIPVLITGESGVGKEVFARAIYRASGRCDKPFISVNCGALPDNLVESTLFGHEKGSFTGATTRSIGKCREAEGGILFLDEVGELKPEIQVKLLRLLQEGEIEPVGAAKAQKVNIRILSATNRPLESLVAQGRFREDLYYRLHGLPLHLPPLRQRRGDIPQLAQHLLAAIAQREQRPRLILTAEALQWLQQYDWPGNVRELQHMLARAALLSESGELNASELSRWSKAPSAAVRGAAPCAAIALNDEGGQLKTLEQLEQEIIEQALERFGGHVGRAAAALGIGQSTLYKRMRKPALDNARPA